MQITLTLSEPIVARLQRQAAQLNVSLDDLALKLFSDTLVAEPLAKLSPGAEQNGQRDNGFSSLQEVVARIQATPPNPAAIVLPTQTIAEVEAVWQANAAGGIDIAPEEWDRLWAEFEQELKSNDRADDVAEGRYSCPRFRESATRSHELPPSSGRFPESVLGSF